MDRVEEEDLTVDHHTAEAVEAATLHNTTETRTLLRRRLQVHVAR
jgi:hypothetical protein